MDALGKLRAALPAGLQAVRLSGSASTSQLRPRPPASEAVAAAALYVHKPQHLIQHLQLPIECRKFLQLIGSHALAFEQFWESNGLLEHILFENIGLELSFDGELLFRKETDRFFMSIEEVKSIPRVLWMASAIDKLFRIKLPWPYCEKHCSYCNFNKYIPRNLDEQKMRDCLVLEAQTLIQLSQVKRITSVFFGGGTPSLANPLTIATVLDAVSQCAHLAEGIEVTLEANPTSADASRLAEFQKAGVNRLSIGVQSLNNAELKLLGRNHTSCDALRTLEEAKKLFASRTSVDLIFGLPGQTSTLWIQGLEELLTMCGDHVSLYQLTLERGTSLFKQVHQGSLPLPDPDVVSEMYECSRHVLQNSGFHQYEVSNFARNGALSSHNLSYWQGSQYIGIGPGAHGRFVPWGDGKVHREARIQTLEPDVWMKEVLAVGHGTRKRTELSQQDILEEVLMLGLRMDIGITHKHWLQFAPDFSLWDAFGESEEVKELEECGLLLLDNKGLRCSWRGLAVLDSLLLTLLNQFQKAWVERERRISQT